jgi:hypothetical protein
MSTISIDELLTILSRHIGQRRGVTCDLLRSEIHLRLGQRVNARDLRKLIEMLRDDGHHVCGTPKTGYFLAESSEELDSTIRFLMKRAMSSLKKVAAMKRVSIPDLFGQLRLQL